MGGEEGELAEAGRWEQLKGKRRTPVIDAWPARLAAAGRDRAGGAGTSKAKVARKKG